MNNSNKNLKPTEISYKHSSEQARPTTSSGKKFFHFYYSNKFVFIIIYLIFRCFIKYITIKVLFFL